MESDSARPELRAWRELEQLVRHLGEELAAFRRRALQAEARLRAAEGDGAAAATAAAAALTASPPAVAPAGAAPAARPERVAELERENAELRARLDRATGRTQEMLDRLRFLRQQHGLIKER